MDKKFYFLAGVLSVVLVVSLFSLVTAWPWWSKDVQNAPPTGNSNIINAHQCSADSVCEVSPLKPSTGNSSAPVQILTSLTLPGTIVAGGEIDAGPLHLNYDTSGGITLSGWWALRRGGSPNGMILSTYGGRPLYFRTEESGQPGVNDVTIAPNGNVTIAKLAGNTNTSGYGYVCVDISGTLTRRQVPCV